MWLNNGTGDGLVLHYNLNGTFIPALIMGADPAMPVGVLEIKFKNLENMDFTKLREFKFALTPKGLSQFATGFKLKETSKGRNIPRSTVVSPKQNVNTNQTSRGRNNPR